MSPEQEKMAGNGGTTKIRLAELQTEISHHATKKDIARIEVELEHNARKADVEQLRHKMSERIDSLHHEVIEGQQTMASELRESQEKMGRELREQIDDVKQDNRSIRNSIIRLQGGLSTLRWLIMAGIALAGVIATIFIGMANSGGS